MGSLDSDASQNLMKAERKNRKSEQKGNVRFSVFHSSNRNHSVSCLTLGHEGFVRLVASVALLDEVLGHSVGPRWRQGVLWCFIVLP